MIPISVNDVLDQIYYHISTSQVYYTKRIGIDNSGQFGFGYKQPITLHRIRTSSSAMIIIYNYHEDDEYSHIIDKNNYNDILSKIEDRYQTDIGALTNNEMFYI